MASKPRFSISLMCLDFLDVRAQLAIFNRRADAYHVDIMDGHFAPNLAISPDMLRAFSRAGTLPMDVHLMTTDPNRWIDAVHEAGASIISPHAETINADAFRTLGRIRALGCGAGIVLNPATPLSAAETYLDRLDLVTIMTVDIGYAHQPFIEAMLRKVEQARNLKEQHGYGYTLQIDGACNEQTFDRLWNAGAEQFVMGGSGLFSLDADADTAYTKMLQGFHRATGIA